jgi:hypothetical protein
MVPKFEMNLTLPKALAVRVAEGRPVIPDVMAASTPILIQGNFWGVWLSEITPR